MLRKLLSFLLSLFIILPYCIQTFAADEYKYDQNISALLHDAFLSNYDDSQYGGAYIGDNNQLVINLPEDDAKSQKSFIDAANSKMRGSDAQGRIETKYVTYTMDILKKVVNTITLNMQKLNVSGVGIDEENNCIVIDAPSEIDADKLKSSILSLVSEQKVKFNADAIQVNKSDLTIEPTVQVRPGRSCRVNTGTGTVTCGAIIEYSGQYHNRNVFIIPGHMCALGSSVCVGNYLLGTVIQRRYGGAYDFAYVLNNGHSCPSVLPNGETLPTNVYYNPPQNLSVTAYGATSGRQTGRILQTNYSYTTSSGAVMSGMLKTSYKAINGDSGAPVWSGSTVGMQSASALGSSGQWTSSSFSICTVMYNLIRRYSTYDIELEVF